MECAYSVFAQAFITDFTKALASSRDIGFLGALYFLLAWRASSPSSSLLCAVPVKRPCSVLSAQPFAMIAWAPPAASPTTSHALYRFTQSPLAK